MQHDAFDSIVQPVITIRQLDVDGLEVGRQQCGNTLTFAAMDVLMNAWLGTGNFKVTHLYVRFGDASSNPGYLAPPGNQIRASNRETFLESTDNARGGLWVPELTAPHQSSTDLSRFVGNKATFYFRIPSNVPASQVSPSANFDQATSWIYAMGLAVAFDYGNRQFDRIVSVLQAHHAPLQGKFSKFQIPPGGQVAIDYSMPFNLRPLD
jgi:hypothetical protein